MASEEGGFIWVVAIGLAIWGWNTSDKLKKERTERIDAVQEAYDDVAKLQLRVTELERQLEATEGVVGSVASAHESLRKTFNNNVDIENKAKVARMTAQGACGTETYYPPSGGMVLRNKACTLNDLK